MYVFKMKNVIRTQSQIEGGSKRHKINNDDNNVD